mgnify:CR=1 FL=1
MMIEKNNYIVRRIKNIYFNSRIYLFCNVLRVNNYSNSDKHDIKFLVLSRAISGLNKTYKCEQNNKPSPGLTVYTMTDNIRV